jgi:hypothetical protein
MRVWEIELTDQAREWLFSLGEEDRAAIAGSIDLLEQLGPNLGRPQWIQSKLRGTTT